ncbi:MAG: acetyl-CoA carboxylase, biotin carboxyl carrier protein, partial [Thermomicrobiaceae bacterium]|nr:acetyl-CoA carboxylase, biotin carboxyl carrier protein [Thermomicrobiaceae bacterium]
MGTEYAALTATIRELVKVMREGGIGQLEVARGDLRIALSAYQAAAPAEVAAPVAAPTTVAGAPEAAAAAAAPGCGLTSPM